MLWSWQITRSFEPKWDPTIILNWLGFIRRLQDSDRLRFDKKFQVLSPALVCFGMFFITCLIKLWNKCMLWNEMQGKNNPSYPTNT